METKNSIGPIKRRASVKKSVSRENSTPPSKDRSGARILQLAAAREVTKRVCEKPSRKRLSQIEKIQINCLKSAIAMAEVIYEAAIKELDLSLEIAAKAKEYCMLSKQMGSRREKSARCDKDVKFALECVLNSVRNGENASLRSQNDADTAAEEANRARNLLEERKKALKDFILNCNKKR